MGTRGNRRAAVAGGVALALALVVASAIVVRPPPAGPTHLVSSDVLPDGAPTLAHAPVPVAVPASGPRSVGVRFSPLDPALAGTGAVRLRVVRATSREPVEGATVVLHGTGHAGEPVRATARSDPEGRAVVDAVPAGPWLALHVDAPGLSPVERADVDVVRDAVLDLGDLEIGTRRTLSVRVTDETCRPVAGAVVDVRRLRASVREALQSGHLPELLAALPHLDRPATLRTNGDGRVEFDGVEPGPVLVSAHLPDRVAARVVVEVHAEVDPDVPDLILREGVVVAGRVVDGTGAPRRDALLVASDLDGRVDGADDPPRWTFSGGDGAFELRLPAPALPGGLWAGADGHPATWVAVERPAADLRIVLALGVPFELTALRADTGEPVPAARVEIDVATRPDRPDERWSWRAATDDAGRVATTLPSGRLDELRVHAPWFIGAFGPNGPPDDPFLTPLDVSCDLASGRPVRMVAQLKAWPSLPLEGRVVDEAGHAVADALVTSASWGPLDPLARTDADGAFVARVDARDGPPARETWLRVLAPGWVVRRPWASVEPGQAGRCPRVTLRVVPSATIRGRVVADDGTAVARAVVRWTGPAHGRGAARTGTSGPDGRFVLPDLEANGPTDAQDGEGDVHASAHGFVDARSASFRLLPGRTADVGDVVLSRGTAVEGRILDPWGFPAPGVRVALCPRVVVRGGSARDRGLLATSDADGRFRVTGVGPYTDLVAASRGPGEASTSMPAVEGASPSVVTRTLRMERGAPLTGRVTGADGAPRRATVKYTQTWRDRGDRSDQWSTHVRTDAEGRFRFESVPLGPATVSALAGCDEEGEATVDAASGADVRLVVTSPEGEDFVVRWFPWPGAPGHPLDTAR